MQGKDAKQGSIYEKYEKWKIEMDEERKKKK